MSSPFSPLIILLFLRTCLVDGLTPTNTTSSNLNFREGTLDEQGSLVLSSIYEQRSGFQLHRDESTREYQESANPENSIGIQSEDINSSIPDWIPASSNHRYFEESSRRDGRPENPNYRSMDNDTVVEKSLRDGRRLYADFEETFEKSYGNNRNLLKDFGKSFKNDKSHYSEHEDSFEDDRSSYTQFDKPLENDTSLFRNVEKSFRDRRSVRSNPRVADHTPAEEPLDPEKATCRMGHTIRAQLPVADRFFLRQACFWCHAFVPPHRKNDDFDLYYQAKRRNLSGELYVEYYFSVQLGNMTYEGHFDPAVPEDWLLVAQSLKTEEEVSKLESCCQDAADCCLAMLQGGPAKEGWCPRTWDGWTCVDDDVPPDTESLILCPPYAYTGAPACSLTGSKTCDRNGTWHVESGAEKTDYTTCDLKEVDVRQDTWTIVMTSVSLVFVGPAIGILLLFKKLRVQRFILLLNLFAALFLKEVFTLVEVANMTLPETLGTNSVMDENSAGCRLLVFLGKTASLAIWTWLLAEGFYLHRLIGAAFRGRISTWKLVAIGWGIPVPLTLSWAVAKALTEDLHCWLGSPNGSELYLILEIPKLLIVVINAGLLLDIARVLVTRLKNVNNDESTNLKRAFKATAFLLPLFGAQFLLTLVVPGNQTACSAFQVYSFFSDAFDDLQGFYVSVAYCYTNREVQLCLFRAAARLSERFGSSTPEYPTGQEDFSLSAVNSANFKSDVTAASVVSNE